MLDWREAQARRAVEGNRADPGTRALVVQGRSGADQGSACMPGMRWMEGVGSEPTRELSWRIRRRQILINTQT